MILEHVRKLLQQHVHLQEKLFQNNAKKINNDKNKAPSEKYNSATWIPRRADRSVVESMPNRPTKSNTSKYGNRAQNAKNPNQAKFGRLSYNFWLVQ